MGVTSLVDINFDLLSVGIATAGILLLGVIIFFSNPKSLTNRLFFYFAIINVIWGISNYLEYKFQTTTATLWALRVHLFLSCWYALLYFTFCYVFPSEDVSLPKWYKRYLLPLVALTSLLTLTPFVFSGIAELAPPGFVTNPERGPGIVLFSLVAFGLLAAGIAVLVRKARKAQAEARKQFIAVLIGMTLTACLILVFNVLLPVVFNQLSFIPLAALFILPIITLIFYSIYQHHLFNLKVATTVFLGFLVTSFSFVNIVFSDSLAAELINIAAFAIVLTGSVKIVRDTFVLQKLTEELAETNRRQETLIRFIGHEVKAFLTKAKNTFSLLHEGELGQMPDTAKPFIDQALDAVQQGVIQVTDILKASNFKKGTVVLKSEAFDLKPLLVELVQREMPAARQKNLDLSFEAKDASYPFVGDRESLGDHVFRNLIDNAVRYTPSGSVAVTLQRQESKYIFTVKDTGVGITDEDKKVLFTEGGHGKESRKVNADSTGFGLFIVKNIITQHGGTVSAFSEGAGKGSTFTVELPIQPS